MALIKENKCNYLSSLLPWQLSNEFAWKQGREAIRLPRMPLLSRLRHNVACIGPNQENQPNLDLFLVRRYKICHFPIAVSYLCIGQNLKNQTNLVLCLVRRYNIPHSICGIVSLYRLEPKEPT